MKKAKEILTSTKKFHINLGLERIRAILELLGNPQDNYKIIHVAGTNGKHSLPVPWQLITAEFIRSNN